MEWDSKLGAVASTLEEAAAGAMAEVADILLEQPSAGWQFGLNSSAFFFSVFVARAQAYPYLQLESAI